MTYVIDGWNLYACKILNEIREYKVNVEVEKTLIEKSHFVETVLFVSDSPDKAYDWVVNYVENSGSDQDHDGKYDLREMETVGIVDLDSVQINMSEIESAIQKENGCSVGNLNIKKFDLEKILKIPNKSSLTLFDEHYVSE